MIPYLHGRFSYFLPDVVQLEAGGLECKRAAALVLHHLCSSSLFASTRRLYVTLAVRALHLHIPLYGGTCVVIFSLFWSSSSHLLSNQKILVISSFLTGFSLDYSK